MLHMNIQAAQQVFLDLEQRYSYRGPKAPWRAIKAMTAEDRDRYEAAQAAFARNAQKMSSEAY